MGHWQFPIKQLNLSIPKAMSSECPSHKTFKFQNNIELSSDFDSGNLINAERVTSVAYNIWIGTDHPQNNYRTWFYFKASGFSKNTSVSFNIKNMHNQTKLLNEGLVPVYRNGQNGQWKRISNPINNMEFNCDGYLQFTFVHTIQNDLVYFAFFYPWSLSDNNKLLTNLQEQAKRLGIYFHRSILIKSLQSRPVELITITSQSKMSQKTQTIEDNLLFPDKNPPMVFNSKKYIFISARVHPGEVPSSHVMNGILKGLVTDNDVSRLLRQKFVFYLVPIINPDGVYRGHYRADPNGVNLNRYYINPSPTQHSPIYGIKKLILQLHNSKRLFGCLDLHAHAVRKGAFIYGNYSKQIKTQLQICLFPKILSMNSKIFQYQGSNFTEKNMYSKDKKDSVSKQGSARVALFKITKNPYFWTLECNYNMGRYENRLCSKNPSGNYNQVDLNNFDTQLLTNYQYLDTTQAKEFFTIDSYECLGNDILDSFLDLIGCHPHSRINNPHSKFKNITNLKLNLLIALLKMTPYHFEGQYRKVLHSVQSDKSHLVQRSIKVLHQIFINNQTIDIEDFLKNGAKQKNQLRIKKRPSSIYKRSQTLNKFSKQKSQEQVVGSQLELQSCDRRAAPNLTLGTQNQQQLESRNVKEISIQQIQEVYCSNIIKIVNIGIPKPNKPQNIKNLKTSQRIHGVGSRSKTMDKPKNLLQIAL